MVTEKPTFLQNSGMVEAAKKALGGPYTSTPINQSNHLDRIHRVSRLLQENDVVTIDETLKFLNSNLILSDIFNHEEYGFFFYDDSSFTEKYPGVINKNYRKQLSRICFKDEDKEFYYVSKSVNPSLNQDEAFILLMNQNKKYKLRIASQNKNDCFVNEVGVERLSVIIHDSLQDINSLKSMLKKLEKQNESS